jgi:asparagine synthase (glutamine-hydrolysing)
MPFAREGALGKRGFDAAVGVAARLAGRLSWDVLGVAPPQVRWAKVADAVRAARDPLGLYQVLYALFTRDTQGVLATGAVRAAQRALWYGLPPEVAEAWRRRTAGSELLHAISMLELLSFTGERLLRDTDVASMAVGLEVRVPLLDHVLIETVAALEPSRRFRPLGRKQILRDVALAQLDPAIFDRPKSGFVLPIDTWARRRLQPQMQAVLADAGLARRVGLDARAVETLWRSFSAGRPGLYWSRIWALYVLLSWCRRHHVFLEG